MRLSYLMLAFFLLLWSVSPGLAQEATPETNPEATEEVTETPEATEEATQEATEEATPTATPVTGGTYIVQPGDNLFRIALRNGLSTQALAEANGITNPALIYVGQVLVIPGAGAPARPTATPLPAPTTTPTAPDETSIYVVQPGDTLYRIALRQGTTTAELVRLNSISNPNLIYIGQRLTVPGVSSSPPDEAPPVDTPETPSADFASGITVLLSPSIDLNAISSQVTQLGVEWVKFTVDWSEVEATQGTLELDLIDQAVETFDNAGFSIMITLIGAPDWARPSATDYVLSLDAFYGPPDDLRDFGTFAGTIAERYAGRVDAYEVWSMPNLRLNWINPAADVQETTQDGETVQTPVNAGLAPVRYIDLLEAAYAQIRAADAQAVVVTAGLAPTGLNDFYNSIDNFVFFEALLQQGALNFSDAMGIQLEGFNNAPDASCCTTETDFGDSYHFFFMDSLEDYREILNREGGQGTALWVTRFGWGTADGALGTPREGFNNYLSDNTLQEQAEFTQEALMMGAESGAVGTMFLYNLNGCTVENTEACYYSVIDADNNARPLFSAIQNATADEPEEPTPEATEETAN